MSTNDQVIYFTQHYHCISHFTVYYITCSHTGQLCNQHSIHVCTFYNSAMMIIILC
jgi:hypothetical protein